jgi:hypothetical protein
MKKNRHKDEVGEQVRRYVQLLRCPYAFLREVEEASTTGVSYKDAFEHVEEELERATGLRHYPAGYGSFRVMKSSIQKKSKKK